MLHLDFKLHYISAWYFGLWNKHSVTHFQEYYILSDTLKEKFRKKNKEKRTTNEWTLLNEYNRITGKRSVLQVKLMHNMHRYEFIGQCLTAELMQG